MSNTANINITAVRQWVAQKLDLHQLRENLIAMNFTEELVHLHIEEYQKLRHEQRRTSAFIWLTCGAVLGFISCILSITNPIPELYNLILFGLTSIVMLIISYGLYLLFE